MQPFEAAKHVEKGGIPIPNPAGEGEAANQRPDWPEIVAVLDALPQQAALLDRDGIVRVTNEAWNRLADGFAPGSVYPRKCDEVFGLGSGAAIEQALRDLMIGSRATCALELNSRSTGCVLATLTAVCGQQIKGVLATHSPVKDGSETDYQKRQAEKMESVGRLVGGIAHDFANLLTLISGYSEIVLNRLEPAEPIRAEIEEIRKAANRGCRLTSQLLGFTRGQAVEPKILDLNSVIAEMEKMLRPIIGEHIELITALRPDSGRIKADAGQMEQVIMNLVLNARDAMPQGGRITIRTGSAEFSREEAEAHEVSLGAYVMLSVTDTGQGMDARTMSHLFEPFFTTKEKGKGTGLGLSTVYGIVKQSRGDVWARSAPGQGSTFTICLPRFQDAAEANATGSPARVPACGTETILIVEDEESVRRLLKHVLSRQGYTVLEAPDGPSALEIARANSSPIHLLLTDMVMPGMSGREVGERFLAQRPKSRVIYMSGYTDDVLVRTGALGPGMSFLQKPLRPEVLAAKVRETLDSIQAR
ncbi:MAG: ATP-binding protein [Acidobacteria bacterium]|nr:ATP-binding protein [Acidobacteriota bacterium]